MTADTKRKDRKITRTRSPHHRVVYSNNIACTTSGADIRLRFACIESATPDEMLVEDQVDVFLGPMEVLGLYKLLGRQLKRFDIEEIEEAPPGGSPAPKG